MTTVVPLERKMNQLVRDALGVFHPNGLTFEVRMPKTRQRTVSGYFQDVEAAIKALAPYDRDAGCEGIYFTLNPVLPALLARSANHLTPFAEKTTADHEIIARRWLPVDFDPVRPSGISSSGDERAAAQRRALECREYLRERGWPDPVVGDSGNGAHLCYRVDLANDKEAHALVHGAILVLDQMFSDDAVNVDKTVANAARIWKLYGTKARKGDSTDERPHRRSKLLKVPDELGVVSRDMLQALIDEGRRLRAADIEEPAAPAKKGIVARETFGPGGFDLDAWIARHGLVVTKQGDWHGGTRYILNPCPWNPEHTDSSAYVLQFPSGAVAAGCHHNGCAENDWHSLRDRLEPGWRDRRSARPAVAVGAADRSRPAASPSPDRPTGLPEIDVTDGFLPGIAEQAWAALERRNVPPHLFTRIDSVVRLELDKQQHLLTQEITVDRMRHELARAARFVKVRTNKKGEETVVEVFPPYDVVRDMLARPAMPLPPLDRVVAAPVFAADGSLMTERGYHASNRTYFHSALGLEIRPVPDAPSGDDVTQALDTVRDVIGEFPFVGEAEFAHAVGLLVLPFARDLIAGPTPLHVIEKPSAGTGGTLLADVLSYPALGHTAPAMTEGGDDDEWRKRITAKLATLPAILVLDNIRYKLDSGSLAGALTASIWEDRILGASKIIRVPVRCVWIATGNNPALSNEIARRVVRIRLDPRRDLAWLDRTFKHSDLREHVAQRRTELVWAAHVLVRAWLVAGRPAAPGGTRLGMYESWSDVVGGVLHVVGVPGFLQNLREVYEQSDDEGRTWRAFVAAWWERHGDVEVAVKDLVDVCLAESLFDLGGGGEHAQRVRLGRQLAQKRDRRFGPYVIVRCDQVRKSYRWRLKLDGHTIADPPVADDDKDRW